MKISRAAIPDNRKEKRKPDDDPEDFLRFYGLPNRPVI
jgi:hypothetical protein